MLASVSGRIFGITESGDLKPARFAHVYLIYEWSGKPLSEQTPEDKLFHTAASAFLDKEIEEAKQANERLKSAKEGTDDDLLCRNELIAYDESIAVALHWAIDNGKPKQFLTVDANEEGEYRFPTVPPGRYFLIARGRAGINDAFWKQDLSVTANGNIVAKLASPEKSCQALH